MQTRTYTINWTQTQTHKFYTLYSIHILHYIIDKHEKKCDAKRALSILFFIHTTRTLSLSYIHTHTRTLVQMHLHAQANTYTPNEEWKKKRNSLNGALVWFELFRTHWIVMCFFFFLFFLFLLLLLIFLLLVVVGQHHYCGTPALLRRCTLCSALHIHTFIWNPFIPPQVVISFSV